MRWAGIVVALLAIVAALNSYQTSSAYARQFPDAYGVARAEARFAPVLARIPANARLGYVTDLDRSHKAFASSILAAQYALAPRLLVTTPAEWAVGNFAQPGDFQAAGARAGYDLDTDFGNGIVLYRKKGR